MMDMYFLIGLPDVQFYAQATDKQGKDITGADGCLYIELKTVQGAKNRVKNAVWAETATMVHIFDRSGHARSVVELN